MDPNINKILFTTDLSEGAREVFKHALYLAENCSASLCLLHIIEDAVPERSKIILKELMGEEAFDQLGKEHESAARNILLGKQKEAPKIEQALRKLGEETMSGSDGVGSTVEIEQVIVAMGQIDDEIIYQAEKNDCDIIVMGHRHHSALTEALLPGHVRKVTRRTQKPVYLVPITDKQH